MNVLNIRMVVPRHVQTQLEAITALVVLAIALLVTITSVMVRYYLDLILIPLNMW